MSKREPGSFRGNVFGGFNRKDVLAYITSVYEELDHVQLENDMLHERCEELEALLGKKGVAVARPMVTPTVLSVDPECEPMPDLDAPAIETPYGLDDNSLTRPEDLLSGNPYAPESEPVPIPIPVPPVYEAPRVKPHLANPYPERARKVKVRPVRES